MGAYRGRPAGEPEPRLQRREVWLAPQPFFAEKQELSGQTGNQYHWPGDYRFINEFKLPLIRPLNLWRALIQARARLFLAPARCAVISSTRFENAPRELGPLLARARRENLKKRQTE